MVHWESISEDDSPDNERCPHCEHNVDAHNNSCGVGNCNCDWTSERINHWWENK